MRVNQKTIISAGILFFLLLVSYRFSLLNETPPPFGGFMMYVFMTIGIDAHLCSAHCQLHEHYTEHHGVVAADRRILYGS